jgi:hypothetical protein
MSENDTVGTSREPLLSKEEAPSTSPSNPEKEDPPPEGDATITSTTASSNQQSSEQDNINDSSTTTNEYAPSAVLLGSCTLVVVLVGLGLVFFVSFFPLWIFLGLARFLPISSPWKSIPATIFLNLLHLRLLWVSTRYLSVMRLIVLPIRRLLLPLVPFVARMESIREQETVQYYQVTDRSAPPGFRKSVRRHYRRMEKMYQRRGIRHQCVQSETSLLLRDIIPLIYQHQQRSTNRSFPLDDFIKRALVVTVVPDGILDLYYNSQQQLVCFQFSILQGNVWHWFMYFCRDNASQAGIWWHGALLAIQRGHILDGVDWVNAQMHQKDSKLHAGYLAAFPTDTEILAQIFPWVWTRPIPENAIHMRLWDVASPPS